MPLLRGLPSGGGGKASVIDSWDSQNSAFNFNPAGGAEHAATLRPPVGRRGKSVGNRQLG